MDPAARAEQILVEPDAILRGDHFVYATGDHGDGWVAKDAVDSDFLAQQALA